MNSIPITKKPKVARIAICRVKLPKGVNPKDVSVRATLYSQSWAPYYLYQRFTDVPGGPERRCPPKALLPSLTSERQGDPHRGLEAAAGFGFRPQKRNLGHYYLLY